MSVNQSPSISVIVPALNEIVALPDNLAHLLADPSVLEIIVVDGGSTDGTREFVEQQANSRVTLISGRAGRGHQMNLGARIAKGEWLLLHHADSYLPAKFGAAIERLPGEVKWGAFRHKFSNGNWKLRLISAMHNWRCQLSGVVYGDQSMFTRADFFKIVGGFVEQDLEDLTFSDQALTHCRSHLLDAEVVTDSRKFRQLGEFRALGQVISIVLQYERSKNISDVNRSFFKPYR